MANNTVSNFTVYSPEYQTAMLETLATNLELFNANSRGAIILRDEAIPGDYVSKTIFAAGGTISHRVNTSTSGVTDGYQTNAEKVDVKVNFRYDPDKMTLDAWRKMGMSVADYSALLGANNARNKQTLLVGTAASVLAAKLSATATVTHDISSDSTSTLTARALGKGIAKFGDMAKNIVCWVMHSKPYFDLIDASLAGAGGDVIQDEAGLVVYGGSPGTLGRPVVVIDSSLESDDSTPDYYTLGLCEGALEVVQSEPDAVWTTEVTGEANLAYRIQGEFAVNFGMRGCTWDVGNGGSNPTLASLATAAYWDALYSSQKQLPGICIISK